MISAKVLIFISATLKFVVGVYLFSKDSSNFRPYYINIYFFKFISNSITISIHFFKMMDFFVTA